MKEVKYLGIILDDKLNWEAHINELKKSLTKTINAFKIKNKIKIFVPNQNKPALYYAYEYSKIQYGIEVYSSAKDKWINKTQIKQNRALKVLFNKDFFTPTQELHKDLDLLLVKDIGKLNTLKFVHRQRNNKTPSIFDNYFIENKDKHKHNTRQTHNLHIKRPNDSYGKNKIQYRGAKLWNAIPQASREVTCNKNFGNKIKKAWINNYYD